MPFIGPSVMEDTSSTEYKRSIGGMRITSSHSYLLSLASSGSCLDAPHWSTVCHFLDMKSQSDIVIPFSELLQITLQRNEAIVGERGSHGR